MKARGSAAPLVAMAVLAASPALASPTMIRLGYNECASCHLSPQGAGLLNTYGRGIDQAQSLRGGEYQPSEGSLARTLNSNGRVTHDVRALMLGQAKWVGDERAPGSFRPRLSYRNVTQLTRNIRFSETLTLDGETAPRPALDYDPATRPAAVFLNMALVQYRVNDTLEFAAGRDQLPSGLNLPDLGSFIKARNRLGFYDAPTQVKMFWWGRRHALTPFAYAPGGNEAVGERESGGGFLYEFDPLGKGRTKLGTTVLRGSSQNGDRRLIGGYARLGFGRWGVLAEHDVTDRNRKVGDPASFRQHATYAQVFFAAREWLVASATGERLNVKAPFEQHLAAGRLEVAARLAGQATVVASTRVERDMRTGRLSQSLGLQVALKTVD